MVVIQWCLKTIKQILYKEENAFLSRMSSLDQSISTCS